MPSIAIIGTEGSGKTVFAAVLAKKYSQYEENKPCLIPTDSTTLKYVEYIYSILSHGQWPPSTPSGTVVHLKWKLHIPVVGASPKEIDMELFDLAGQDIRVLFEQEKIKTPGALTGGLLTAATNCINADILIYLINLKDFMGEQDDRRRIANQSALKSAMDYLGSATKPKQICLLFTQADQYKELAKQAGGWQNLAKQKLPYVYAAHLSRIKIASGGVAAVSTTEIVQDAEGRPRRVPARNFEEAGLNSLMKWLTQATVALEEDKQRIVMEKQAEIDKDENIRVQWVVFKRVVAVLIGIFIMLAAGWGWAQYNAGSVRVNQALAQQQQTLAQQQQQALANAQAAAQAQLQQQAQAAAAALAQQRHDAEVKQIYKLCTWNADQGFLYDSISLTNGSEYDLTNVILTVNYVLNGQKGNFQLSTPSLGSGQTCTWGSSSDPSILQHDLGNGPNYTTPSFTCDQTQ